MPKIKVRDESSPSLRNIKLFKRVFRSAKSREHHQLFTSSMVLDYLGKYISKTKHSHDHHPHKNLSDEINKISTCAGLGRLLVNLDKQEHQGLYDALGKRLYDIVSDIFDMRDIPEQFHLQVFQQLGYLYVSTLINCSNNLIQTIATLPEHDRLLFLNLVGFDKVRSFIHGNERVQEFFKIMPPATHDVLKKELFLYDIKINCNGPQPILSRVKKETEDFDLSYSKTEYSKIINPIKITDDIVIGYALLKNNSYKSHLVIYNASQDSVELVTDKSIDVIRLIDEEKKIFAIHEWGTNRYFQLSWIDGELIHTNTTYAKWHSSDSPYERFNDMIPLPDGKWMILSQEDNNVINLYKGWYIDILDPETFTLSRKLNVNRDQYEYMTHLTLMPDGKTILTWADNTVKARNENCCLTTYSICLISTDDYSVQRLILPIDPREVQGKIEQVNVQDNQIEIEISVEGKDYYSGSKSSLYYSFEYENLRLKNDSAQMEKCEPLCEAARRNKFA